MILLVLLNVAAFVSAEKVPPYNLREGPEHFENFIVAHNKVYSSDEEKAMRYEIFLRNLEEINQLNAKHEYAEFDINEFSDLTPEEFRTSHACYKASPEYRGSCRPITQETINQDEFLGIPAQFDWRDKNVVSSVKNQGQTCGSCWAFSVVGNVESINAIKTGTLVELSEQQLVDCDKGSHGCSNGSPSSALEYLTSKGAMSSESYPYVAAQNECRYNEGEVAVKLKDCVQTSGTEDFIAEQLVAIGPLSIGIDGSAIQSYKEGLISESCGSNSIDHAVLLVGYGVDSGSGLEYWLVKNSWGESWGEQGYFRMQKGVNCLGLLNVPSVSAVV